MSENFKTKFVTNYFNTGKLDVCIYLNCLVLINICFEQKFCLDNVPEKII